MRIRAALAALSVAGASFALFAPSAHAAPSVCAHIEVNVNGQGQTIDQCVP